MVTNEWGRLRVDLDQWEREVFVVWQWGEGEVGVVGEGGGVVRVL